MSAEITKVGLVACSGESIAEGTISRLATRRVLELLRPDRTVTICLPLFIAGNEGEHNFARMHPTITIDGCPKQCARWGTEQHSGPVSGAVVISEILGTGATGCSRSARCSSGCDTKAVWIVAEHIAAEVDRVLAEAPSLTVVESGEKGECACSAAGPGETVRVAGETVTVSGLRLIYQQCFERGIAGDDSGATAVLDAVKIYHRILPGEEEEYRRALAESYRKFLASKSGEKK